MGVKESVDTRIMDKRTLIAIVVIAILWRTGISLNGEIAPWESLCSGIALFVMSLALFVYIFLMEQGTEGLVRIE